MRTRAFLIAAMSCVLLAGCTRAAPLPRPTGTLEPEITASSSEPRRAPRDSACALLTAQEREDLVGMTMDAEVPTRPIPGTHECIWTHSLIGPSRSAIRVVAFNALTWVQTAAPQISAAIANPRVSAAMAKSLEDALKDVRDHPSDLPTQRICDIFWMLAEAYGVKRGDDVVWYASISALPAAYGTTCEDGILTEAGFGEYGLKPSIALNHGVTRLVEAAHQRAVDEYGDDDAGGKSTGDNSASPEPSDTASPTESPSESPSPSASTESPEPTTSPSS